MTNWRSPRLWFGALFASWLVAILISWTPIGPQIDNDGLDWMSRLWPNETHPSQVVILAIDEDDLNRGGGPRNLRPLLTKAIAQSCAATPTVIAVDVVLADPGDPKQDRELAQAIQTCSVPIVLASSLHPSGTRWEDPLPMLAQGAKAVGHVQSLRDLRDGMLRRYALEIRAAGTRRWALGIEALRFHQRTNPIESPDSVQLGSKTIPARLQDGSRSIYLDFDQSPTTVALHDFDSAKIAGKAVVIGVTSIGYSRDRVVTPKSAGAEMPGVDVHAYGMETILGGRFLQDVSQAMILLFTGLVALFAGLAFRFLPSTWAYLCGAALLVVAAGIPHAAFRTGYVFPLIAPLATALFSLATAAALQFFATRNRMEVAERDRERYQQAIHMVTHEMRTPLTAIQGSSELMGRYSLAPEKQKELASMINQESKRLAKMVQTFLDVERLGAGQMDFKTAMVPVAGLLESCVARSRILAERKKIEINYQEPEAVDVRGDRELLEYAVYNLLTNAVKYSPAETRIEVEAKLHNGRVGMTVKDQGYGMTLDETKRIFDKFFRTKRAEKSNEVGTGIGLALVKEIVERHGGTIEVESAPNVGSRFTLWIPRAVNEAGA